MINDKMIRFGIYKGKTAFQFIIAQKWYDKISSFEEFILKMTIEGTIDFNIDSDIIKMIDLQMSYLREDSAIGLYVKLSEDYCSITSCGKYLYEKKSK